MSEAFVSLRSVSKSYDGRHRVVEELDLDIGAHEFLTLLGPSGSGKTTILTMLAGFEAPTTGDILMKGRAITGLPPHRRNIGVVFQNYALFPH
ncbi:MAG: ATP-binding cassette domain-containing protein, partial [Mesorhizobium sp.]